MSFLNIKLIEIDLCSADIITQMVTKNTQMAMYLEPQFWGASLRVGISVSDCFECISDW